MYYSLTNDPYAVRDIAAPIDVYTGIDVFDGGDNVQNTGQPVEIIDQPQIQDVTNEVYLYLYFKDLETGDPIAVNGKLLNKANGETLSTIVNSYEAEIHIVDIPLNQLEVQLWRSGYKKIIAPLTTLKALPTPREIFFEKGANFPMLQMAAALALIAFALKRKKQVGKVTVQDVTPFMLIAGGLLAFDFIDKILTALGIWKSKDTANLDDASTNPNSFWNPNYWINIKPANKPWTYAISTATAQEWLDEIRDAFAWYDDNEEQAIAVMKRCRTKANASFLSYVFNNEYGEDLLSYLRGGWWPKDRLSDADVNMINNFINQLPDY